MLGKEWHQLHKYTEKNVYLSSFGSNWDKGYGVEEQYEWK